MVPGALRDVDIRSCKLFLPVQMAGVGPFVQVDRQRHAGLQMLHGDIISCFSDIACFLLPHPGLLATTSEHFQGQLAGITSTIQLGRISLYYVDAAYCYGRSSVVCRHVCRLVGL